MVPARRLIINCEINVSKKEKYIVFDGQNHFFPLGKTLLSWPLARTSLTLRDFDRSFLEIPHPPFDTIFIFGIIVIFSYFIFTAGNRM